MAKIPAIVGAFIVVVVLLSIGVILKVMEVIRMRMAAPKRRHTLIRNDLVASPLPHPQPCLAPPQETSIALSPIKTRASLRSMSLMDRMREVQSLMLQIHDLDREPANSDNRAKIQELQRRITKLSDVPDALTVPLAPPIPTPQAASNNPTGQPAPHSIDGRDD